MLRHWVASVRDVLAVILFIALIGLLNRSLHAQQRTRQNVEENRERFVLLNSGRIMMGRVTRNAGGYLIDQNNGQVQLAVEDVKCIVDSLHEGYCKQRDGVVDPTPATHLALANWCISFRLYDEASDELKKCLKTDPENEAARRLLQRLADTIRSTLPRDVEKVVSRKTYDGFVLPEVESLGGLSKEAALIFVTRIQPLMLHKCGNASCHGMSSPNEFKVISSRVNGRASRHTAERNLAETFRQIDFDDVTKSKILEALKGAHGGKGSIFVGQNAADQRKILQSWVRTVVQEKKSEEDALEQRSNLLSQRAYKSSHKSNSTKATKSFEPINPFESTIRQVSLTQDDTDDVDEEPSDLSHQSKPRELKPDPTDAAALAREPEDAFDPEQFNQKF